MFVTLRSQTYIVDNVLEAQGFRRFQRWPFVQQIHHILSYTIHSQLPIGTFVVQDDDIAYTKFVGPNLT